MALFARLDTTSSCRPSHFLLTAWWMLMVDEELVLWSGVSYGAGVGGVQWRVTVKPVNRFILRRRTFSLHLSWAPGPLDNLSLCLFHSSVDSFAPWTTRRRIIVRGCGRLLDTAGTIMSLFMTGKDNMDNISHLDSPCWVQMRNKIPLLFIVTGFIRPWPMLPVWGCSPSSGNKKHHYKQKSLF